MVKMTTILKFLFLVLPLNLCGQSLQSALDTMKTIGYAKKDYYWYVNEGNLKFNKLQFRLAEKDYENALQLLTADSLGKKKNAGNHAVGELIIRKNLLEVNQGLKDQKDVVKYATSIQLLEQKFSKSPDMDISDYFETQAKSQYKRKEYKEALRNIQFGIVSCKSKDRKRELEKFGNKIEAFHLFNKKQYQEALNVCNHLASDSQTVIWDAMMIDLRGRIYFALGNKTKACEDWKIAFSWNFPISKLRMNNSCR